MKEILTRLTQHEKLSRQQAKEALLFIGSGAGDPYQITTFLSVFMMRSIAVEELAGFRDALLRTLRCCRLCLLTTLLTYAEQAAMAKTRLISQHFRLLLQQVLVFMWQNMEITAFLHLVVQVM